MKRHFRATKKILQRNTFSSASSFSRHDGFTFTVQWNFMWNETFVLIRSHSLFHPNWKWKKPINTFCLILSIVSSPCLHARPRILYFHVGSFRKLQQTLLPKENPFLSTNSGISNVWMEKYRSRLFSLTACGHKCALFFPTSVVFQATQPEKKNSSDKFLIEIDAFFILFGFNMAQVKGCALKCAKRLHVTSSTIDWLYFTISCAHFGFYSRGKNERDTEFKWKKPLNQRKSTKSL